MALIAVSGHLKDVSGANIAGSVVFQLVNYGAAIPRVIGTNALVPTNVTFTAAANGAWSGNIQSNDSIDPGASNTPPTTYYTVQFRDANGAEIQTVAFNFTGAGPSNLDSQAPLVTIPLPTAPPNTAGLLAANQTWTGVNTFTGANVISAQSLENIKFADQYAGADLGAKINAADIALGLKGGEIWVTTAAGTTISTAVNLRNNLRFIQSGSFNVSGQISIAHGGITISGCGLNDTGSSNPGTLLTWTGSAGTDMISILGTSSNRLDKCVLRDLLVDGGNSARYTIRAEKMDSLELHSMRFRNGATASFYAVDSTGIKFFGVSSGVNPSYAVVLDWGTGGFSWFGGAIENDLNATNPLILIQGFVNNVLLQGLELDATTNNTTNFGGFIQTNGFDTNSSFAGAPTGGAGAPNNVTIHECSFFYDGAGVPAASQGADVLVTGTATHQSNSVSIRNCYFAGLSVGVYAVKVDQSTNFSIVNTVSNAHTTATTNLTANSTFNRLEFVTGTDPVTASGAASGSRLEIKQGTAGQFNIPNSSLNMAGSLTGASLTGASSGNNVTLLNYQTAKAAITGNAADQAMYSYSLLANTVATGKGLRITASWSHSTGAASVVYKLKINGTALAAPGGITTAGAHTLTLTVMAAASTTFDLPTFWLATGSTLQSTTGSSTSSGGMSWTSNQTIELDFNVAATDQVTPGSFVVELVQ